MEVKHNYLWWGPPKNFNDRRSERKISWLELFYDLVYVAVVGQLANYLSQHPTWQNAGYSLLLFSLVFWSWVNGSEYYDLHGDEGIRTRLITFWQMLAVAAVAITIQDAFEGRQKAFAISFAMIQVLITYMWWSVGLYDPSHRVFNKFYTINYLMALALIIVSVFTSYDVAIKLWVIALLFNLTAPLIGARTIVKVLKQRGQVFTASTAIVERFGSFTIIVLAESILATVTGATAIKDRHPGVWIAFMLGILISFLLWSLYFDMLSEQETKKGYSYMQWFIFLHFPLLASFCVTGACIKIAIGDIDTGLPATTLWIFCIALAVTLFMIVGLTTIMQEDEEGRSYIRPVSRLLIIIGILILVIPLFGGYLSSIAYLGLIAVLLFIPVFVGVRKWVRYKFFNNKQAEK